MDTAGPVIDGLNRGGGHCRTENYRTGHWLALEYLAQRFCTEQRTKEGRVTSQQRPSGFVLAKQSTEEYKTAILCFIDTRLLLN